MLYWSFTDDLSVVIIVLYALSIYLAYSLTRMTGGAPTGWYVIIVSFVLVLVRRAVELYYDAQTQVGTATTEEAVLTVFVGLFLTVGLYMLREGFKRQLTVARQSQTQP